MEASASFLFALMLPHLVNYVLPQLARVVLADERAKPAGQGVLSVTNINS